MVHHPCIVLGVHGNSILHSTTLVARPFMSNWNTVGEHDGMSDKYDSQWSLLGLNFPSYIFPLLVFYTHKSKNGHQLQLLGLTLIRWHTHSRLQIKLPDKKILQDFVPLLKIRLSFFLIHCNPSGCVPPGWCIIHLDTKCQDYFLLTNSQFPFSKESMHAVNVSHQFWVPKGEINHISLSHSSCQYLY